MQNIKIYFILFIFYSFIGWLMEVVVCSFVEKKAVNRGFLIGPYCPIYGCGLFAVILLLDPLKSNPYLVFILEILICSAIEYFTSYIMEKLFNARWWDYSNAKFNLNGRIKLSNSVFFGLAALLFVYFVHPVGITILGSIPQTNINIIFYLLLLIFLTDNIVSFKAVSNIKKLTFELVKYNHDEIINVVKEKLSEAGGLTLRLLKAFPSIKTVGGKIETTFKTLIDDIKNK